MLCHDSFPTFVIRETSTLQDWSLERIVKFSCCSHFLHRTSRAEDRGAPDLRGLQIDSTGLCCSMPLGSLLKHVFEMRQENVSDDESELEETGAYWGVDLSHSV